MKKKVVAGLISMFVLGLLAFALLGALVLSRIGRPIGTMETISGQPPLELLRLGTRDSLVIARDGLIAGRRNQGVRALDAAARAADIGRNSAPNGPFSEAFTQVFRICQLARKALQNGRDEEVPDLIASALHQFDQNGKFDARPTPERDLQQYVGAIAINAQGVRLGEVRAASNDRLTISLGGLLNLFGALTRGEERIDIEASQVLFGEHRKIGSTLIALPTTSTSPRAIAARWAP